MRAATRDEDADTAGSAPLLECDCDPWLVRAIDGLFLVIAGVAVALLCAASLVLTELIPPVEAEQARNSFVFAAVGTALAAAAFLALRRLAARPTFPKAGAPIAAAVAAAVTFAVGLGWTLVVNYDPVSDSLMCISIATDLAQGNPIGEADYLQMYPYQSGLVILESVLGHIFGFRNWFAFRLINVLLASGGAACLVLCAHEMFGSARVTAMCSLLTCAFFPLAVSSNFMYGNIPSTALCLGACLFQMRAIRRVGCTGSLVANGLVSAFLMLLALLVRLNSLVVMIAVEIVWLLAAVARRKPTMLAFVALNIALYLASSALPTACMQSRTGLDLEHGTPKLAWIAMGMQESRRSPGWYNEYVIQVEANGATSVDEMSVMARQSIAERLETFASDPAYALRFYALKTVTQWCEPTFQSLWISLVPADLHPDYATGTVLERSFTSGVLENAYIVWCDALQSVVYAGALFCILLRRREIGVAQIGLLVVFLGGLAFHTLWEAKSLYVLPYFAALIPYAAAGLCAGPKGATRIGRPQHLARPVHSVRPSTRSSR